MKKIKAGMATVLFSVLMGIFTYKFIYRISPRTIVGENIVLAYVNENISNKNFDDFEKIVEGTIAEELVKDIEKIKKYLKGVYIFTETQLFEEDKEIIGVIDTGAWYLPLLKDIEIYFEKTLDFYVLRDEYKDKYLKGKNLYMTPYRGQFIISLQPEPIKKFDGKDYIGNKRLDKILDKEKKNRLGIFLYNGKKEKTLNIKTAYITGKLEKENISLYIWQESTNRNLGYGEEGKKKRKFIEYLNPNFIYFSAADPNGLEDIILKGFKVNGGQKNLAFLFQGFLGVKFSDVIEELDGELLFDLKNKNAFFSLKEAEKIKRAFKYFGKDNVIKIDENHLVLEEDYFVYGTGKLQKGSIIREFAPHNFLYLKLDFEALEKEGLDRGIVEINGYSEEKSAYLHLDADKEAVQTLISYIEKEVKND